MLGVKVDGLEEMEATIRDLNARLEDVTDPAAMAAAQPILARWRSLVPVLDANYQRSLAAVPASKGRVAIGTQWLDDLDRNEQPVLYAKPLEIGNSRTPAQPSMRPALAAAQQEAIDAAGVPINEVVRGTRPKRRRRRKA